MKHLFSFRPGNKWKTAQNPCSFSSWSQFIYWL